MLLELFKHLTINLTQGQVNSKYLKAANHTEV